MDALLPGAVASAVLGSLLPRLRQGEENGWGAALHSTRAIQFDLGGQAAIQRMAVALAIAVGSQPVGWRVPAEVSTLASDGCWPQSCAAGMAPGGLNGGSIRC
jgi:hypothetical protein